MERNTTISEDQTEQDGGQIYHLPFQQLLLDIKAHTS